ncbi:MAG: undecaprenyl-phosphate glucose phosphotransferase, partial [Oceanihabitans sp.]
MSTIKQGKYSVYLKPISYIIDLTILLGLGLFFFFKEIDPLNFVFFIITSWIIQTTLLKFYEVYRFTKQTTIMTLILRQMLFFALVSFAFSGIFQSLNIEPISIVKYVAISFLLIAIFKFAIYFLLQKYRVSFRRNYRITVILGKNKQTSNLEQFFNKNPEYGYIHKKTFSFKDNNPNILEECFNYITEEQVDE